jgi:hypothetical protein
MFVCYECCVLSGRGLCDELITRPGKSYRLSCVVVCVLETDEAIVRVGPQCHKQKIYVRNTTLIWSALWFDLGSWHRSWLLTVFQQS